jgi:hypothetical protein
MTLAKGDYLDVAVFVSACIKIKTVSVQTQLNSIYFIEVHISTYLRSSLASQLVFKAYWEETYIMYLHNVYFCWKILPRILPCVVRSEICPLMHVNKGYRKRKFT